MRVTYVTLSVFLIAILVACSKANEDPPSPFTNLNPSVSSAVTGVGSGGAGSGAAGSGGSGTGGSGGSASGGAAGMGGGGGGGGN
jgi:hypothetical protein